VKLGYADIDKFLQKPDGANGQTRAVLLYGPNRSLIEQRTTLITKKVLPQGDDGFNLVAITPDQLKQTPTAIADELTTMSFFGGGKVILFKDAEDKHLTACMDAVSVMTTDHYLIILADELGARSALRVWAEKETTVAALPCYDYDLRDMGRLLQAAAMAQNARLDRDAGDLLVQLLGTQADLIPLTIAKLVDYAGGGHAGPPAVITADMVRLCCVDQTDATTDDIIQDIMNGALAPLQRHLHSYYAAGENSIALLRLLQNYLYRLKTVQIAVADGAAPDQAMQALKPPVFFKQKQSFMQHVQRFRGAALDHWLAELLRIEAACKQTGAPDELLVRHLALEMATTR
jgi:DNA polymerase-3 subunit delta